MMNIPGYINISNNKVDVILDLQNGIYSPNSVYSNGQPKCISIIIVLFWNK